MRRLARLLLVPAVLSLASSAAAEACAPGPTLLVDDLNTPWDDLLRSADTAGAVPPSPGVIRRAGAREATLCGDGTELPWTPPAAARVEPGADYLRALPLRLTGAFNSHYPSGENDELLWAGRGASAMLSGGVAARWSIFSAAVDPQLAWSENATFRIVPNGRTGDARFLNPYYGTNIDYPQRFGAAPYYAWAPGQSYLRADVFNVGFGVSTENMWFGPGVRNAITMSSAGPGFPHAFVGTSRPADIWIGKAEVLAYWGRLERSRYMPDGTHPLITGVVIDYTPRWLPDLTIGLSRNFTQVWDHLRFRDYFNALQPFMKRDLGSWYGTNATGEVGNNPRDNQLASLFFRWRFPESAVELHGEWAREDSEASIYQVIREPDHSQGWLIGMEKLWRAGPRWVRFQAELVNLSEVRPLGALRGTPVYYIHPNDLSWTNEGQLLGAWVGPAGSAQTLAVDVFGLGGRFGGYIERVRRTDDYYWRVVEPAAGTHDAELAAGLRQVIFAGPVDISWDAALMYRWSRDYLQNEGNVRLGVQVSVPLGGR